LAIILIASIVERRRGILPCPSGWGGLADQWQRLRVAVVPSSRFPLDFFPFRARYSWLSCRI